MPRAVDYRVVSLRDTTSHVGADSGELLVGDPGDDAGRHGQFVESWPQRVLSPRSRQAQRIRQARGRIARALGDKSVGRGYAGKER